MLLALAFTLTACGEASTGEDGAFYVTISSNPENLDPQLATDSASMYVIRNIYSSLMEINSSGSVVCCAAQSYSVSDDGLTYEFTLRDGLCWYTDEGEIPLTAYDYVYAFYRIFDSETHSPYTDTFSSIRNSDKVLSGELTKYALGVSASDDKTVIFKLSEPNCDFLKLLTLTAAMPCNEELFLSTGSRYGLSASSTYCCGAFRVTDWNYDPYWYENYITLERIDSNSLDGFKTYAKSVTIGITDDATEWAEDNGVDLSAYITDTLSTLSSNELKKATITEYTATTVCLVISPQSDIFIDDNGRKAISSALNEDLIDSLNNSDYALYNASGIIPDMATIINTSFRYLCADSKVNFVLNPSDYWDAFYENYPNTDLYGFTLIASDEMGHSGLATYVAQTINEKLSIYATVDIKTSSALNTAIENLEYDFAITEIKPSINTVEAYFYEANSLITVSDDIIEKITSASTCKDITSKKDILRELEQYYVQYGYVIPLCYKSEYLIEGDDIADICYDPYSETLYFKYAKSY